jgi:hypothetical protein
MAVQAPAGIVFLRTWGFACECLGLIAAYAVAAELSCHAREDAEGQFVIDGFCFMLGAAVALYLAAQRVW